jgi:hypothetical protein
LWVQMRSYLEEKIAASVFKTENTALRIRRTDHPIPLFSQKLALTSPTSGGWSVGIVRSWTEATEWVSDGQVLLFPYSCNCIPWISTTGGHTLFQTNQFLSWRCFLLFYI